MLKNKQELAFQMNKSFMKQKINCFNLHKKLIEINKHKHKIISNDR